MTARNAAVPMIAGYLIVDQNYSVISRCQSIEDTLEDGANNNEDGLDQNDVIEKINEGDYHLFEIRRKLGITVEPKDVKFEDLVKVNF